jgi:hypothetical protein
VDVNLQKSGRSFHHFPAGGDSSSAAATDPSIEPVGYTLGTYASSESIGCVSGFEDGGTLETGNTTVFRVQGVASFQGRIKTLLEDHARIAIIVGAPLPEKRHMYWNFVSVDNEAQSFHQFAMNLMMIPYLSLLS